MGLLDVLFGRPKRRRRRRSTRPTATRPTAARQQRERLEAQQRQRRELDREAARWLAADDRRRRQERERTERQGIRQREREQRQEARMMARAQKARDRAIEAYITHGLTRGEAEQMVDREPDWTSYDFNPRRRKRNPGLSAVAGEIAKDVIKGGLIAAAQEEAKEWRNRWHTRQGRPTPPRVSVTVRRNPARSEPNHADPRLREMSQRFHGRPDQILHLDEDQRRPPPKHVVLIGQERATVYRVPRGSERAGADWEHEAGDAGGILRRNVSGRRLLVADERGRVYLLQGSSRMRFDPDAGLVG